MPVDGSLRLLLPELVVALTGVLALSAGLVSRRAHVPGFISLAGLALAGFFLATEVAGWTAQLWSGTVLVDGFSTVFKAIFLGVAALVVLASLDYLEHHRLPAGEFFLLVLLATVGMMFMAGSLNLLTIYLGLECLALASYALAGFLRHSDRSTEAAVKYVLIGAISSGIILFGMSLVFGVAGSVHLADVAAALASASSLQPALLAGMVFLIAGFGVKMAVVPFHMWAPDVYHGSPAPVAAFLIAASEAAAFAAALRIFIVGLPALQEHWRSAFILLSVLTMTIGNVAAITQSNMRRMLAYSAVAQAGYLLVGLAVGTERAVAAMIYYMVAYAFATVGAFAVVMLLGKYYPNEEIADFRGLSRRSPLFASALAVFMLSFIGIPPTAGFFGKFYLFQAAVAEGFTWLALVMVLNSVISIPYYWGVVQAMYLRDGAAPDPLPAPGGLRWATAIGFGATLLLGLFPDQAVQLVSAVHVVPALLAGGS